MTNMIFRTVLAMSVSGSLLILALLGGKQLFKNICSRQWQYYIWLIVILRLLLPFGPEISLMRNFYQAFGQAMVQNVPAASQENQPLDVEGFAASSENSGQEIPEIKWADKASDDKQAQERLSDGKGKWESTISVFLSGVGWFWLIIALGILIRKITAYQSFLRYVMAGAEPVSDIALLDELAAVEKQMGMKRKMELCVNPLLSSPTLTGILRPCIVLPSGDISLKDFRYIVLHELVHCKRWDILYKWLVQTVVCLHWFNPLVHVMSREITNACEFSCDEAVVAKMGYEKARDYGKTLLDAMAAVGKYREASTVVTLSANKRLLRERLGAIMSCGEKSVKVRISTAVLTICIILGTVFIGICPTRADVAKASETEAPMVDTKEISPVKVSEEKGDREREEAAEQIEEFYGADSMPMFQLAFGRLDEEDQSVWLDRIYRDGEIAFFAVSLDQLNADSPLIGHFARKAYADGSASFFSVLADHMDEETLEEWLDLAMADQESAFQSILFDRLEMEGEKAEWERELEKTQAEEYRKAGITMKGKDYYYQGQLVNIFLDPRPDRAFYTLSINPAGTVNVKILRGENGQITGAAYLSEEEFAELFGDDFGEDVEKEESKTYPRTMYVNCLVCKVREGAGEEFKVVGLMAEEEEVTVLDLVEGSGGRSWYRIDKESLPEDMDISAEECYIRSDLLREK